MAHKRSQDPDTLEELQGLADRTGDWIRENPLPILAALGLVLLAAAVIGGVRSYEGSREDAAAAALARVQGDFRQAMGATPQDIDIPEPANPETGKRVRGEFVDAFLAVADEHGGTSAAVLARSEAGRLYLALGDEEAALAAWSDALAEVDEEAPLRGMLAAQVARLHERAERWAEAGEHYEQAGAVEGYPLRYWALADAARSFAEAGQAPRALALYDRVRQEAPTLQLPLHVRARLDLLARRTGGTGEVSGTGGTDAAPTETPDS